MQQLSQCFVNIVNDSINCQNYAAHVMEKCVQGDCGVILFGGKQNTQ